MKTFSCTDYPIKVFGVPAFEKTHRFVRLPDNVRAVSSGLNGGALITPGARIGFRTDSPEFMVRIFLKTLTQHEYLGRGCAQSVSIMTGDRQTSFFAGTLCPPDYSSKCFEGTFRKEPVMEDVTLWLVTKDQIDNVEISFADDSIPCGGGSGNGGNIAGGGNSGSGNGSGGDTRSGGTRSGGSPNSFKSGTLDKVSKSKTFSYTLAVVSGGNVDSWMERDLMDLNGDGRPDIIHGSSVNYTKPYIYPEYENTKRQPFSGIGSHPYNSHSKSRGVVRMGEFAEICTQTAISGKGSSFIRGLGASYVNDSVFRTLADLNGDGLPDIVCSDGNVSLGTGYGFLNPQK